MAAFALAGAGLSRAASAADHDGDWTVRVITERGNCERSTSFSVRVAGGTIEYAGYTSATVHGTVTPRGVAKVNIRHFEEGAVGSGRLHGRTGSGGWHGEGRKGPCSGRWEAQRR